MLWGSTPSTVKAAYEQHIGRLPKKAKIEALAKGRVLHFVNGTLTKGEVQALLATEGDEGSGPLLRGAGKNVTTETQVDQAVEQLISPKGR